MERVSSARTCTTIEEEYEYLGLADIVHACGNPPRIHSFFHLSKKGVEEFMAERERVDGGLRAPSWRVRRKE